MSLWMIGGDALIVVIWVTKFRHVRLDNHEGQGDKNYN
jgi:hypothetical protein